jgi:type IV pilus assembly protein PilC
MAIKLDDITSGNKPKASGAEQPGLMDGLVKLMQTDISIGGGGLGIKFKESLYMELETLLVAGLDLQSGLEILTQGQTKKKHTKLLEDIRAAVISGSSFSAALAQTGKFSDYEVFSIQIGEESGKLNEVLHELRLFFEKMIQFRRQLVGALTYPMFILGFSLLAVYFLLNKLVPVFSGVYARFDGELPALTRLIIDLSGKTQRLGPWVMLGLLVLALVIYLNREQELVRKYRAWLVLRLPVFGNIVYNIYLARFCQSMHLLLQSKVPLLQASSLVGKMVRLYPIEQSLTVASHDIMNGKSLHESLGKSGFYSKKMLSLIKIGEESGQLDQIFKRLAQQHNAEAEQAAGVAGSLIEPIIIIFLGLLVGVILVAMYLPLFQMGGLMGR